MHIQVKICGITGIDAARAVADAGADAVGFVFAKSPRRVDVTRARALGSYLPPFVTRVAVFRYPSGDEITAVVKQVLPDLVQAEPTSGVRSVTRGRVRLLPVFHEGPNLVDEIWEYKDGSPLDPTILLEAAGRGGRGVAPDWNVAAKVAGSTPLVLAGGLNPTNVRDAILRVRPVGVDVSSGVESSPGVKEPDRIREFVLAVREAEELLSAEVNK